MHVDEITSNGKYKTVLIRETFRDNGVVKHRTIANITDCSEDEIEALKIAFKHKGNLVEVSNAQSVIVLQQGLSVGAVIVIREIAQRLGIVASLGDYREGRLALWQIIARVINQGSRLSATRLASSHAACDILDLNSFTEDDLYANLDWLALNQDRIENEIFKCRHGGKKTELFLYDVTSSYLEGKENELGFFGYNRDKKSGKPQIVIGLLCDHLGYPVSVEVFDGNTCDTKTFSSQIKKVADRFGGAEIILVGDRGMIKIPQIEELGNHKDFHFITAITKAQIETLIVGGVLQLEFFEESIAEITEEGGYRYVLKRNPRRAAEIKENRDAKLNSLKRFIEKQGKYLLEHSRAKFSTCLKRINAKCKKLKLERWIEVVFDAGTFQIKINAEALSEVEKLDGCYALKTDLPKDKLSKEEVHGHYKALAKVEWAFRTMKTIHLELRPIHVRLEDHVRAHVFVVMLAYLITKELDKLWKGSEVTITEGIMELSSLTAIEVNIKGKPTWIEIPQPRESVQKLISAAKIKMPSIFKSKGIKIRSRKTLKKG